MPTSHHTNDLPDHGHDHGIDWGEDRRSEQRRSGRRVPRLSSAVLDPQTEWTRRKLQVLLVGAVIAAAALLVGGIWSIATTVAPSGDSSDSADPAPGPTAATSDARDARGGDQVARDRLADQPLPTASLEQALPGPLSTAATGTLRLPPPTERGPAGVMTGFPQTPAGALAQLVAIDQAALESASVAGAQDVVSQWAAPGGPTAQTWTGVGAVAALLSSAGLPADGAAGFVVTVDPSMGFIKGQVGDDFVVPCVNLVITATITATTAGSSVSGAGGGGSRSAAAADCQRMVWDGYRWLIGPGTEPAPAPSLWPGTQASFDVGYEWLEVGP